MWAEDEGRMSAGMNCGYMAREQFVLNDFKRTETRLLLSYNVNQVSGSYDITKLEHPSMGNYQGIIYLVAILFHQEGS